MKSMMFDIEYGPRDSRSSRRIRVVEKNDASARMKLRRDFGADTVITRIDAQWTMSSGA